MHGLQLPICTEIHSLNSCVQLASLWCAYRGFWIPCGHFWGPTAFYCLKSHPRFNSLFYQASLTSCPQSVSHQGQGTATMCTQDSVNSGCCMSPQERRE